MNIKHTALCALIMPAMCANSENVACVGNSITYGYGLPWGTSYPISLQKMLDEGKTAGNFGVSGSTFSKKAGEAYWKTDRFTSAYNSSPEAVVIELGTNDSKFFMASDEEKGFFNYMYGMVTEDELKADYRSLIDTFAHLESHPEIWTTLQPYSNNEGWMIMDTVITNTINPLIKDAAIEKGVNIIDLHSLFHTPEWYLEDSVHPNEQGAKELARIVHEHLTMEKPSINKEGNTLQVDAPFGCYWYKDGRLLEGAQTGTLSIGETGKYKALVKVNAETDSYVISKELEVTELDASAGTEDAKAETVSVIYNEGTLSVSVPKQEDNFLVNVYNAKGSLLYRYRNIATKKVHLKNGIHFVIVKTKKEQYKETLIVK